ncbi:MAG: formate transporter [Clostridiales bacterium]|nr:formate transporter [Clostridiales bacterium]
MNLFTPAEFIESYSAAGEKKANQTFLKLFLLGIFAGGFIALGGAASSTAAFGYDNIALVRMISGLFFPIGLILVILTGSELFTGNCLIAISVLSKRTTWLKMARNLVIVYAGNFVGSILVAAGCAYFGQLNYAGGALAVYTVKIASAKCALPFANAFVSGIFCNILVCAAVMLSLSAKDIMGRIAGAYVPIVFFVICGFEHCIANMYYITAGLFAMNVPKYAALVADAGINVSHLSWSSMFVTNLLPVTLGNIVGGVFFAAAMWWSHHKTTATA